MELITIWPLSRKRLRFLLNVCRCVVFLPALNGINAPSGDSMGDDLGLVQVNQILGCEQKDAQGLNDFQQLPTQDFVAIPRVGINRFRLPITFNGRHHDAVASMYVGLNEKKNGVSMSRLLTILQEEANQFEFNSTLMRKILNRYRSELRDQTDEHDIDSAQLKLSFQVPLKQQSLKSGLWGWQYYPLTLVAKHSSQFGDQFFMSVDYEYSSTCPCSLSMAKQYEQDFADGKTTEGVGIGVAHGQRSKVKATVEVDSNTELALEEFINILRAAIPTETQSLVKRVDEQAFAILNGSNPMFVEHASKRLAKHLNNSLKIKDWIVELEHYESLHSHNAAAVIYKGKADGLRADGIF